MNTRTIGKWHLTSGMMPGERQVMGEDGPYFAAVETPLVTATHERGKVFTAAGFADEGAADAFVGWLPEDFDAAKHPNFTYWRTSYSSDDWGPDDEFALMDDEEMAHALGG